MFIEFNDVQYLVLCVFCGANASQLFKCHAACSCFAERKLDRNLVNIEDVFSATRERSLAQHGCPQHEGIESHRISNKASFVGHLRQYIFEMY